MIESREKLEKTSDNIKKLIINIDTDSRGDLLYLIGEKLKKEGQGFTEGLLIKTASDYGLNKIDEK